MATETAATTTATTERTGSERARRRTNRTGAATREALVAAARANLVQEGFSRTSARSVAARAGCSQASLFYHFDGVPDLLLAVLDEVSDRRMAAYREPLLSARTPASSPVWAARSPRRTYAPATCVFSSSWLPGRRRALD